MKPRNKFQREIISNSQQLRNIEKEILAWTKEEILEHKGFVTKTKVSCMDCGSSFSPSLVSRKRSVCPHCQTKLVIEETRKKKEQQRVYVASAEIFGEFQVIRNFEVFAYYRAGEAARYFIWEVLQHWILSDGAREIVARNHGYGYNWQNWNGDMEIRQHVVGGYYSRRENDVYPLKFHPSSKFKAEYKKYGINKTLEGLTFLEASKIIPKEPMAETLLKARQYSLLACFGDYDHQHGVHTYWASIKICLRNKYKIKDVKIWFDYLDLLRHFGKDLRNAHYVCPKNLNKEHDKLVKRKRRAQDKLDAEKKRKKMLEDTKIFNALKSVFFGIAFSDGKLKVRVLESVEEVMKEGDKLHHCVFANEYYKRKDSLILSATVNGEKTETVEVSLKTFEVVQSRGLQNKNTAYHDRIISLVNQNMHLIKERMKPKKKQRLKSSTTLKAAAV